MEEARQPIDRRGLGVEHEAAEMRTKKGGVVNHIDVCELYLKFHLPSPNAVPPSVVATARAASAAVLQFERGQRQALPRRQRDSRPAGVLMEAVPAGILRARRSRA